MNEQEYVELVADLRHLAELGLIEAQRDVGSDETRWVVTPAGEAALEETKAWT